MYDMTKFKKKYFNMKLKNGRVIDILPPKLKILKKISRLASSKDKEELTDTDIEGLIEAITLAFNKNRQNYKISSKQIEEEYDLLEITDFLQEYFNWINEIQNIKN